jgi:hypothetical protein
MNELKQLAKNFQSANANFDRENDVLNNLHGRLDRLPLTASADEFAQLHAELELQKRRLAEFARLMQVAGSRLDEALGAESIRVQRETDQALLDGKLRELDKASAALAEKKLTFQRLATEIPVAEAKLFILMEAVATLQRRARPVTKQVQPRWYDDELGYDSKPVADLLVNN